MAYKKEEVAAAVEFLAKASVSRYGWLPSDFQVEFHLAAQKKLITPEQLRQLGVQLKAAGSAENVKAALQGARVHLKSSPVEALKHLLKQTATTTSPASVKAVQAQGATVKPAKAQTARVDSLFFKLLRNYPHPQLLYALQTGVKQGSVSQSTLERIADQFNQSRGLLLRKEGTLTDTQVDLLDHAEHIALEDGAVEAVKFLDRHALSPLEYRQDARRIRFHQVYSNFIDLPGYALLYAGRGELLNALYARCNQQANAREIKDKLSGTLAQIGKLVHEQHADVRDAVGLVNSYWTKFRTTQIIKSEKRESYFLNNALDMLTEATRSKEALTAFLKNSRRIPTSLLFDPSVHHVLEVNSPADYDESRDHATMQVDPNLVLCSPAEENHIGRPKDFYGDYYSKIQFKKGLAVVLHGSVEFEKREWQKTKVKRIRRPLKRFFKAIEVEEDKGEEITTHKPAFFGSEKIHGFMLRFPNWRTHEHLKGRNWSTYSLVLPESKYRELLPQVRRNPQILIDAYAAAYPYHAQGIELEKPVLVEKPAELETVLKKATIEEPRRRR